MDYTDEKISTILNQYKKKREREIKKYHEVLKTDPEWREKNKENSKKYYHDNKPKYKQKYKDREAHYKIKNLYQYYLRNNKVDIFKDKHKDKYSYLIKNGYVTDDNFKIEDVEINPVETKKISNWFITDDQDKDVGGLDVKEI